MFLMYDPRRVASGFPAGMSIRYPSSGRDQKIARPGLLDLEELLEPVLLVGDAVLPPRPELGGQVDRRAGGNGLHRAEELERRIVRHLEPLPLLERCEERGRVLDRVA